MVRGTARCQTRAPTALLSRASALAAGGRRPPSDPSRAALVGEGVPLTSPQRPSDGAERGGTFSFLCL